MSRTSWPAIIVVYGAGVVAAVEFGKVGPAGPTMVDTLALSIAAVGWLISSITAVSTIFGWPAGSFCRRIGERRALVAGAVILSSAGLLTALLATDFSGLLIGRVVQGIGYLLVVVSAPSIIARLSVGRDVAIALSLWSTFVPVGLAIGNFAGGVLIPIVAWDGWFAIASVGMFAWAGVILAIVPSTGMSNARSGRDHKYRASLRDLLAPGIMAAGFTGVSLIAVAVIGLQPIFLVEARGLSVAGAGEATSLISIASAPGSLLVGWLAGRGLRLTRIGVAGLVMPLMVWLALLDGVSVSLSVALSALALFASGILVATVFAAVPRIVADASLIAPANGLIAMFGSLGALLGPPLGGALVDWMGWQGTSLLVLVATVPAVVLPFVATRLSDRRRQAMAPTPP